MELSVPETSSSRTTKVVVASTVMLSFISFWRAAAIVLCDLASSAFYAGGIAETAIGKSAPWFILGIMLFSYAVRAIYLESCAMFVRGGVYKVVHEALGGTLAKFSVSALMFDYVLTGPISAVSAGLYLAGLINELAELFHREAWRVPPRTFAAAFAVAVVLYFWRKNILGVHESSQKALRIMQLTTAMAAILLIWCVVTVLSRGYQPVPLPSRANIRFEAHALGWLAGTSLPHFLPVAIIIGLGHSLLAMSGFETLAQVYREIAAPKLKNLERTGLIVVIYSLLFTGLVSFFAVMLIPDQERVSMYIDNLIGGLAMHLVGPVWLRLLFHCFVVLVGAVILSGAVNTAILGSNGVLNRVAEDGVLPDWFRHPHHKYGTTHRMINSIALMQIAAIVFSRGDVYILGEAYAFGVVWSFAMKALSVLVLRYKQPAPREWKVPLNLTIGHTEIPVGLGLITATLFVLAVANVVTKQHATIAGGLFTVAFFILFYTTERIHRRGAVVSQEEEKFRLETPGELSAEQLHIRPGNILVAARNPNALDHLKRVLEKTDTSKIDIVVVTVKPVTPAGSGEYDLKAEQVFSDDVALLFSRVVSLAEKAGKTVTLLVVPGVDPNYALVETAARLHSSTIVMGLSPRLRPAEQAKAFGDAWEKLPPPRPQLSLQLIKRESGEPLFFNLGPHPPRLWPEDVDLVHRLWLELADAGAGPELHHRDVVHVALRRLDEQLRQTGARDEILSQIRAAARTNDPGKGNTPTQP